MNIVGCNTSLSPWMDKENMVNGGVKITPSKKPSLSPGRVNSAPLRLVDANKMIFAPSSKTFQLKKVVGNREQDECVEEEIYEPMSTLSLVNRAKEKMNRLQGDLAQVSFITCSLPLERRLH